MTISFTICSNNFLAQAKTLVESLLRQHPEMRTIIFLVDEKDESIDYQLFSPAEITIVTEQVVPGFTEMISRYTVLELNTAIRPFLFQYLNNRFKGLNRVYYLDPDMYIYDRLDLLDRELQDHDIIITPHFTEPIPLDGLTPFEDLALLYGVFNVGFLALNPSAPGTQKFLEWWGERTRRYAYADTGKGLFTDQIWFNLVPVFFEKVKILLHKGYNMAIWNLHERKIKNYRDDGRIEMENGEFLAIYHFSNWNYFEPGILSKGLTRYSFANRPDLVKLYTDYRIRLQENGHDRFRQLECRLPVRKMRGKSSFKQAISPGVELVRKMWHRI